MKISWALSSTLAVAVSAHLHSDDHAPIPQIVGGKNLLAELRARNVHTHSHGHNDPKQARQPLNDANQLERREDQCGPGFGSCAATDCCSPAGFCGVGTEYCAAPDCQLAYGPACDGNQVPSGASTAKLPRPRTGEIPLGGAGIYNCVNPGEVAFTFDDGPYLYTEDVLNKLDKYNAKATFFITGNNLGKGPIDSTPQWSNIIKRMAADGHQVASHTWSHQNLTSLDSQVFENQMVYNEMAFRNILGYWPSYMRPPYSQCNDTCGARLADLGYVVTYFDLDTEGYLHTTADTIQTSKNLWDQAINGADPKTKSYLEIEHDIHFQVAENLTDYILASMYAHGFKSVTVGDCLGDPKKNWYRYGNETATTEQTISLDGTCNAATTCVGSAYGNCCSGAGYCGNTTDYCGVGCNPVAGNCTDTSTGISSDGSCGPKLTCIGSEFGNCCSASGFCGRTADYCDPAVCNPLYGSCVLSSSSSSISSASASFSASASASASSSSSPSSSPSSSSLRSTSIASSSTILTSPSAISTTTLSTSSSSVKPTSTTAATQTPTPTPTPQKLTASRDGTCGGKSGYTCKGSVWGTCCSGQGRCGWNLYNPWFNPYCGKNCQDKYGSCA
ncbi:polysaccharide deacetylase [Phlyctema vagabunda]|uniref:Polysaccharide deacetylase n=1 Tax=Phlyctema vagabunda TaxID=108571 RepID=A0ABR4PQD2_9HELO